MKNQYAVYVIDANGWDEGCPDSQGFFFGAAPEKHGGMYFRHVHLLPFDVTVDLGDQGFMVIESYRQAVALRKWLDATGDWVTSDGTESRPAYGIVRLLPEGRTTGRRTLVPFLRLENEEHKM